jgi:hypothetical protein
MARFDLARVVAGFGNPQVGAHGMDRMHPTDTGH